MQADTLLPFERTKRDILLKVDAKTSDEFGLNPIKTPTDKLISSGVININKPQGPTSHQVSDYIKKILNISKAGHSGTLDPNVTGVLPIALQDSTKIVDILLPAGKEYVCLMHLHKEVDRESLQKQMQSFVGITTQLPPIRSAIKRQQRQREIYHIKILEIQDKEVLFKIGCQAGFYIRKFVHDLGKKLNTNAHMSQLIRTKAGPFKLEDSFSLHDLKDAYEYYKKGSDTLLRNIIKPKESALGHLPKIWVFDSTVDSLCHGADLFIPGISKLHSGIKKDELVAIMTLKEELICISKALDSSENIVQNQKGLAAKTKRVFLPQEIYPKYKKTN